jgi:hypothetical protein
MLFTYTEEFSNLALIAAASLAFERGYSVTGQIFMNAQNECSNEKLGFIFE